MIITHPLTNYKPSISYLQSLTTSPSKYSINPLFFFPKFSQKTFSKPFSIHTYNIKTLPKCCFQPSHSNSPCNHLTIFKNPLTFTPLFYLHPPSNRPMADRCGDVDRRGSLVPLDLSTAHLHLHVCAHGQQELNHHRTCLLLLLRL